MVMGLQGELWNAISLSGRHSKKGAKVKIIKMKDLTLYVEKQDT
jgi:membrane-bound ClpP family serine protease